jgi:hypothetical protein
MPRKQPRTEADLKEAATDVVFEFKMFRQGWSRLDVSSPSLGKNTSATDLSLTATSLPMAVSSWSTAKNNAPIVPVATPTSDYHNIEGILIHFRNLIEFFFTEKEDKDDLVLAHHYTGKAPQKAPAWAKAYGQRCNELLAHLTYRRTQYRQNDNHHWTDILEMYRQMDDEIIGFLDCLTPERRAWFK